MSNLLKEAIVDAKALRDSALKNAETTIIEKYSSEVRETLEQLLEQDELSMDLGAEEPMDLGAEEPEGSSEEVAANIPLAATDNLNEEDGDIPPGLPAEGDEVPVNIDLDALQEAVAALENELEEQEEVEINEEELAALFEEDEEDEEDLQEVEDSGSLDGVEADEDEEEDDSGSVLAGSAAAANATDAAQKGAFEEGTKTDELIDSIVEKLTVDMGAELAGWAGRSSHSVKWEMEKALAQRRSTDMEEELRDLKKAQEELVFENNQINEQNDQYKQAFNELKENLQDVNLSNARLLYTNRVLRNTSLNERQKTKIAEAISNAGSVTEAKTIYHTLESTVEAKPNKRRPQSLSEAIGRRTSVLRATRQESTPSDPFNERMKRLAGIK
jgi:hypothetical protein